MAMPIKPEHLKKVSFSVGVTPATLDAIEEALEPGQSRSAWIAEAIDKHLKSKGIKVKNTPRN